MLAIFKKELYSYFINPIGYVFAGIFLAFAAALCCYNTLISRSYSTSTYFYMLVISFIILIPLLTMRLFAEERKLRTEQLLMTSPVSVTGMVMGKFLAAFTLFFGCMVVSLVNFIPLYVIAAKERAGLSYETTYVGPVTGQIFGCFVGVILIGAAFIAIGTFISSLTENQLAAAVITIATILVFIAVGFLASLIDFYPLRIAVEWISVLSRFQNFTYGIFDFAAVIYYLTIAFVFLFLTVRVYEKRRWS